LSIFGVKVLFYGIIFHLKMDPAEVVNVLSGTMNPTLQKEAEAKLQEVWMFYSTFAVQCVLKLM